MEFAPLAPAGEKKGGQGGGVGATYQRAFAGDSFNTAVYLARSGIRTRYLTRLGDDAGSEGALQRMMAEQIDASLIDRAPGRCIGLYLIDNDAEGERTFTYYRESSPARQLFDAPLKLRASVFYFTGITLAITRSGHANLVALLASLRAADCQIAFDPNYRALLWESLAQARSCCMAVLPYCDVVLPTLGDDQALWGHESVTSSIDFYRGLGATEVVVKGEDLQVEAWSGSSHAKRKAEPVAAVDTTGAGDAFNAAYLASRLQGADLEASLAAAQGLAAEVVQHRGAIIPVSSGR